MGYVGVSLCDFCGKRTTKFYGKLVLQDTHIKYSVTTARSWSLCKKCFNKLGAMESTGDTIREDLELHLDKIRLQHNQPKILKLI